MKKKIYAACLGILVWGCLFFPELLHAEENTGLSAGQSIYVPAYSHIYIGNRERPFLLTVTLSIRNVDPQHPITLTGTDYYGTKGNLLKKYITTPVTLKPLESREYIIDEDDQSGGSGASFIVTWEAVQPVNPPIAESVMIGAQSQQGVSFTSRGRAIIIRK